MTVGSHHSLAPFGQKGPRAAILLALKCERQLTAAELAERLGASLNAIRHHLKELESESLVDYERERRGVGAPAYAYRLTSAGEALFPQRYEELLLQVLDRVVARDGREAAVDMLVARFDELARRIEPELAGASTPRRLDVVSGALADEGFMAQWEETEDGGALVAHNCAIRAVAERFPEICAAEVRFLASSLGADVERQTHILSGCCACEYSVRFPRDDDEEPTAAAAGHTGRAEKESP